MMDKRVEFRYIPHNYIKLNGKPLHFVGEPMMHYSETIIEGDINSGKYIVWYVWGEEIVGFLTVGYQNLHLYLWEAMKLLIMPSAPHLRQGMITYKTIVSRVLACRPDIKALRKEQTKIPSVIRAEFTREREKLDDFRKALKENMDDEKEKQRKRFFKLKDQYNKEGIEVVEDESEIGSKDPLSQQQR